MWYAAVSESAHRVLIFFPEVILRCRIFPLSLEHTLEVLGHDVFQSQIWAQCRAAESLFGMVRKGIHSS